MATIAVGDIHGNLDALRDLLGQVEREVGRGDVVVFLGDYIDRGADSRACIDRILALRAETLAEVVCLRGNHEDWFLRTKADYTRHSWLLGMDGLDTIRSYSPEAVHTLRDALGGAGLQLYQGRCALPYDVFFDAVPSSHKEFFDQLALSLQNDDGIFTHAGLDPRVTDFAEQTPASLIWGHAKFPDEYWGDKPVVYGHWDDADSDARGWPLPRIGLNTIGIDTISYGVLTAIRMPDRRVFQSARYLDTGSS